METIDERKQALASWLGVDCEKLIPIYSSDNIFAIVEDDGGVSRPHYRVMTEEEANKAEDKYLDSYIDGVILPGMRRGARADFNKEKWKKGQKILGRGGLFAVWDGVEHEITVTGKEYLAYRVA